MKVAVQSPQSNGQVERLNRDLKAMLAKLAESATHSDWRQKLSRVEYAMNNTVHTTTKLTPSLLLFGVEQRGPIVDEMTEYLDAKQISNNEQNVNQMRNEA